MSLHISLYLHRLPSHISLYLHRLPFQLCMYHRLKKQEWHFRHITCKCRKGLNWWVSNFGVMNLGSVDSLTSVNTNWVTTSSSCKTSCSLPPSVITLWAAVSSFTELPSPSPSVNFLTVEFPSGNSDDFCSDWSSVARAESPCCWACGMLNRECWAISTRWAWARDIVLLVAWCHGDGTLMLHKVGFNGTELLSVGVSGGHCSLLRTLTSDSFFLSSAGELPHHPNHRGISTVYKRNSQVDRVLNGSRKKVTLD